MIWGIGCVIGGGRIGGEWKVVVIEFLFQRCDHRQGPGVRNWSWAVHSGVIGFDWMMAFRMRLF